MTCQKFTCTVTVIINGLELAPYFFQTPLPSCKGHAKAFLNRNKNMKNNFCMSRTNARYPSELISPWKTFRGGWVVGEMLEKRRISGQLSLCLGWAWQQVEWRLSQSGGWLAGSEKLKSQKSWKLEPCSTTTCYPFNASNQPTQPSLAGAWTRV